MTDLLEQGTAWLEDQRTRHMTRTVAYQRGGESVDLAATIGRTIFEQADDYGVIRKTESRDFLVLAADLVLNGQRVLPRAGDRIREVQGAQAFIYEVMAPGSQTGGRPEPPYRWSDPYHSTFRIHTKHVGTEEA